MTRIVNAWMINRHINNALWVHGPDAGIFPPEEQAARVDKLLRDLEGAARLELITPNQYRRLKKVIHKLSTKLST